MKRELHKGVHPGIAINNAETHNDGVNTVYGDPLRLLYNEFRWQRRMMFGVILLLLVLVPGMMWWMQSNSIRSIDDPTTQADTSTPTSSITKAQGNSAQAGSDLTTSTGSQALSCMNGNCVSLQTTPAVVENGSINVSGAIRASRVQGDGSGLSNVNAQTFNGLSVAAFIGNVKASMLSGNIALLSQPISALSLTLSSPLAVSSGGIGTSVLTPGSLLMGNGSGGILSVADGAVGQCLLAGSAGPNFAICPGADLQTAFTTNANPNATLTTTAGHTEISFQAGSGLDDSHLLQVKSAAGATTFAVGSGDGAVIIGGGSSSGQLTVHSPTATTVSAVLQAATGQTADVLQVKAANGQNIARIDAQGNASFTSVSQTSGITSLSGLSLNGDASLLGNVGVGANGTVGARLQVAALPTQVGLLVKGSTAQLSDLLQIQNASGANLLRVDASGTVTAVALQLSGSISIGGHIVTTGGLPTIGTLLPGIVPLIVGDDAAGTVTVTTTIGLSAGILAHVTFASPYTAIPKVVVTANSAVAASLPVFVVPSLSGFDIMSANVPAAASIYAYSYIVVQ